MKTLLRLLKSFWLLVPLLWLASLLACWLLAPRVPLLRGHVPEALAIVSACFLLVVILRQYQRIRAEHNLENLLQIEVDRSWNATGEFRDQQVLRERLKHAISMLRTDRSAGGGGSAALSDLPWYLVMGMSAAGKTSLLTHSGLSASVATANDSESGTQHCDWYFSPDAVMIDTAGRYLRDDQSASEFAAFLRMLRKQRGKAAINGLVLVVSLPELLAAKVEERDELAARLSARVEEYADCLDANPPVYLMLSKTDQLPGFRQAFDGLDLHERQQPLGMTFGLAELRNDGLHAALRNRLGNLQQRIGQHVDAQMITLGADASSELLNFPRYFAELGGVLEQFLDRFAGGHRGGTPLLLRGLYFTSALQTDRQLSQIYEDDIADAFALQPALDEAEHDVAPVRATGNRSYFITDTFRRVIFPDRDLGLYQSRLGRQRSFSPLLIGLAALAGVALIGWQGVSFSNNRQWLEGLRVQLATLAEAPDREQQLAGGKGLEVLRMQMETVDQHRLDGVPLQLGAGLYRGEGIHQATQAAYLEQLRSQVLEPITLRLQTRMRAFNSFATDMSQQLEFAPAPAAQPRNASARAPGGPARRASANDAAELSAITGGLSLSEEMLGRLDEHQVASIIDAYNTLKLYLLLTEPKAHPDPAFVGAALPQAWASPASQDAVAENPMIQANARLYLQLVEQGLAPSLARNQQLIDETRQSLKSFMISSSLVDREYLRLQLESSRQFPALKLSDMVPMPGRALLHGAKAVPAIHTRQGWESFVMPELIKLVSGNLRNESDWVLDGEGGDAIVQKANFIREFMTRYKRDYTQAWYAMLSSVGVRRFGDLASATEQLGLLSDVQNSPVKSLLAAVNDNTRWDLPVVREVLQAGAPREDGFWNKVTGLFDKDAPPASLASPLPAIDDGSLAKRFEPVSRVFAEHNAEGADSTIMDRYLAALRKLKVRMNNIQRSQDIGKGSKQLISETLEGQPSEVTTVRNYVETSVDTSQDGLSRSLQGLFSQPIQYAWETLRDPAGAQIAKAWAQQIAKPWEQVMAHRYPISGDSHNEASVKDLQRFVDPDTGLLPAFKRNEIGNLSGGEGLGMGGAAPAPALVSPGMLNSIDKASSVGQVIASLSDRDNGFEIMLEPSSSFTDIVFTLDGQEQHYRNGRSSWSRFAWPGTSTAPGARLDVVTLSGARVTVFDFPGRWGLLRMNESARVDDLDGIQQRFSWNTASGRVSLVVRNFGGVKLTDLANVKSLSALNGTGRSAQ